MSLLSDNFLKEAERKKVKFNGKVVESKSNINPGWE